ncbi:MAG: hypothetical protein AVO35_03280 [Candidatus Aegiribacteria sp. MLS_C]|nr:MAG: hypothetical protein AVO35_03280 [Candidatus Aegiribacteria sp. MLS_C]
MSEGRELSFLEKAIRLIPGYKGYKSKEERRDNDHLFRMTLVDRLERLRTDLDEIPAGMKGSSALRAVNDFDRVQKRLERVTDEIRFASRGYRGWFDMHKVREDELDSLYAFDIALVEDIEGLEAALETLQAAAAAGSDLGGPIDEMVGILVEFSKKMSRRSELMIDLERNQPVD